jgi:hypothetical protein
MFKINEIDFDFKKQPKEYFGMRKYKHLLKQVEDIKIDGEVYFKISIKSNIDNKSETSNIY